MNMRFGGYKTIVGKIISRTILFVAVGFAAISGFFPVFADAISDAGGVASGLFWTIDMQPTSARTSSTGSSAILSGGGVRNRNFENNPAVLAYQPSERGMDFVVIKWFDDLYFNGVYGSFPSDAILYASSLGFSIRRMATEDYITDQRGFGTDRFQYEDISVGVAFGFNFSKGMYAGVGVKYIGEKIYTLSGSGVAFDWGVAAKLTGDFCAGVSLLNFPGFIKYNSLDNYEGALKSNLKLSLSYEPSFVSSLRPKFFADINNYFVRSSSVLFEHEAAFGVEVEPYDFVVIGAGIRANPAMSGLADLKFSFGIGFSLKDRYRIDYAGEILPFLGDVHRLGISAAF